MSGYYSIKDLERLTGIKAHTLRIWEKRYNIVEPQRSESNIRSYTDEDLKKLLNISILVKNGYKISKVADLCSSFINEKIIEISRLSNNHNSEVEGLIISMIELDESKFEKILNSSVIKMGFERTVYEIIYPLFEKIGVLWQTGSINPAQEHFISNLVRRKLFVAIDGLSYNTKPAAEKYVLYLPEWELHEIGLLLYDYLIRKSGNSVIYLGQSLAYEDLVSICNDAKPEYILTNITSTIPSNELRDYIKQLSANFNDKTVFLSGLQTINISFPLPANIIIVSSVTDFKEKYLQ